jgi:ADP-ribose pyrophosphatase
MPRVEIQKKRLLLDDFFKVEEASVRYERFDGEMSSFVRRLSFERGDSVAALICNPDTGLLTFVNQFKYPTCAKDSGWMTETVAGMIDGDETPEHAIRREIEEEAGYVISRVEHISTFYVSPGGSSERIVLFYVEVALDQKTATGGGLASENEDIQVIELTIGEALAQVASGQIADAKTILGIFWLNTRLAQQASTSTRNRK